MRLHLSRLIIDNGRRQTGGVAQEADDLVQRCQPAVDFLVGAALQSRQLLLLGAGRGVIARRAAANRLGYIFAHVAIVVICLGGLLDSELPVRLQTWLFDKQPVTGNMLISEVPASTTAESTLK